jgi:hypothetical protein
MSYDVIVVNDAENVKTINRLEPPMTAAVNVLDLSFGMELEVTLPIGTCPVGGYHNGVQVPQLPAG